MIRRSVTLALFLFLAATDSVAEVKLPSVFGDSMVLQRQQPVPVWGRADPGETVTVSFAGQMKETTADRDGRFSVTLDPMEAAGPRKLTVKGSGGSKVEFQGVLTGEVWICSGQSNMAWPISRSRNGATEVAEADHPSIRLYTVARRTAPEPAEDVQGVWQACTPETAGGFSAVAYFFGRAVQERLDVPVGLINTSFGGTPSEAWTPMPAMAADESLRPLLARWKKQVDSYDEKAARADLDRRMAKWKVAAAAAREAGKKAPRPPRLAPNPITSQHHPAGLWNAMVAPLVPYACRGVIWYQGESNAGRADQYRTLFPLLITSWRSTWGRELPFGFVQLANFRAPPKAPGPSKWAELREAQRGALVLPATGQAVAIDIGAANDIHPKNKQEVGRRLALWARATVYGEEVEFSGPQPDKVTRRRGRASVRFTHAGGLRTTDGKAPVGFTIAGKDGRFHVAEAKVVGETVVLSSKDVKSPLYVRYAWADNPPTNLVNGDGLPASPFRTDDLPFTTKGKQ